MTLQGYIFRNADEPRSHVAPQPNRFKKVPQRMEKRPTDKSNYRKMPALAPAAPRGAAGQGLGRNYWFVKPW